MCKSKELVCFQVWIFVNLTGFYLSVSTKVYCMPPSVAKVFLSSKPEKEFGHFLL